MVRAGAPTVKLTNLQDGELSATSTDAVTGAQLWNTNQQLSDLTQAVQNQQPTGSSSHLREHGRPAGGNSDRQQRDRDRRRRAGKR